ncbi:hypothetical protein [Indiicoccus explosivorum]|uniref:hypothetical protein n=1 Tax=Indiicoccus explosivorum TaxID=1917864 RepID=UPI000B436AE5|nr:hypothetical protein [Indiicoccus explosivorum]
MKWSAIAIAATASLVLSGGCAPEPEEVPGAEVPAERTEEDPGLPESWIIYDGRTYTFDTVMSEGELDEDELTFTEETTGEDDGTEPGIDIYVTDDEEAIYIQDEAGSSEEWLRYTAEEE